MLPLQDYSYFGSNIWHKSGNRGFRRGQDVVVPSPFRATVWGGAPAPQTLHINGSADRQRDIQVCMHPT